jgi:hypothetical protein
MREPRQGFADIPSALVSLAHIRQIARHGKAI